MITAIVTVKEAIGKYTSVSFCDSALHRTIQDFTGVWVTLCGCEENDWDFRRTDLIEAYRMVKMKGHDGGNHLAGIHEAATPLPRTPHGFCPVILIS